MKSVFWSVGIERIRVRDSFLLLRVCMYMSIMKFKTKH